MTDTPSPVAWRYLERTVWNYCHGETKPQPGNSYPVEPLYSPAALLTLQGEIDALTHDMDRLKTSETEHLNRAEAAEAEVVRLREALVAITAYLAAAHPAPLPRVQFPHGMTEAEWNARIGDPSYEHGRAWIDD